MAAAGNDAKVDIRPGETKALRAAREVLRRGHIEAQKPAPDGVKKFCVTDRGGKMETVTADPAWVKRPTCTCMQQYVNNQFKGTDLCPHIVAVLVREEDLRCQLLDVLL